MDNKVYCSECKFLEYRLLKFKEDSMESYKCINPKNMKRSNDWYGNLYCLNHPKDINQNNNCGWFDKK